MNSSSSAAFMDPRAVITHFHLHVGDVVADFGAGVGNYVDALSAAVGPSGRIYACEIQKNIITRLTSHIHERRLGNVHPVWCDLEAHEGTKLRSGLLDAGMIINTLFQIEDKKTALLEMARVIRKGGKLFVVDWSDSFGGMGPQPGHVIKKEALLPLLENAGFTFERDFPAADHHYGIALRRA
jgi:ubiquinone/menaquinone biosynthesis C-methylase UbiE